MTIANDLTTLNTTKLAIKTAIENKGQDTTAVPFTGYPALIDGITTGGSPDWTYQSPADWLPLPENELGVTRVSMLALVSEIDSTVYIHHVNATGTMIDWGDGTIEPVVTGSLSHTYDPALLANISGYGAGQKQAVIKLLGGTITHLQFTSSLSSVHIPNTVELLELNINASELSNLIVSASITMTGGLGSSGHRRASFLKCFKLGQNSLTSLFRLLLNASNLEYAKFEHNALALVTSTVEAFNACSLLGRVDGFTAPLAINCTDTFANCRILEVVTGEGAPIALLYDRMFNVCMLLNRAFSLNAGELRLVNTSQSATTINISALLSGNAGIVSVVCDFIPNRAVNCWGGFRNAGALEQIDFVNPIQITSIELMFFTTPSLKAVNLTLVGALPTDLSNLLHSSSLSELPNWVDLSESTNLTQVLLANAAIAYLPDMTFSSNVNMFRAFQSLLSLKRSPNITLLNGATITNGDLMFTDSPNLQALGSLDVSKVMLNFAGTFAGFTSLVEVNYFNIDKSMNFAHCPLSGAELNKIFNNLMTVAGQTITITGTAGRLDCDTSIATDKGWAVVQ